MAGSVSKAGAGVSGAGLWGLAAGPRPSVTLSALWAWLARQIAQEERERRFFLWLPVAALIGILGFFGAAREPELWASGVGLAVSAGLAWFAQRRGARVSAGVLCLIAFLMAGFLAAGLRTQAVSAPVLAGMKIGKVTGWILSVDERANGSGRLLVRVVDIDGMPRDTQPALVRVTLKTLGDVQTGETIRATMRLMPPSEAAEPGGYDFAREAFFQSIGAVGSIAARVERVAPVESTLFERFGARVDRARNNLTRRIATTIGGDDGAVAAALVTGKRGLISEAANDALRGAGIYHVVSISGLHMVLAAGLFMWSLRSLLALFPSVALNWPVKKISAGFAMLGASAYCIFAGSEVATERSLIMILVMLGAVLVDRPALSMRNLAVAALIVMAREPESVMGPSFQMSFAAVAAMVALFERGPDDEKRDTDFSLSSRLLRAVGLMLLTTLVAGLATGPFASFHFHRINPYSMIGNALTLPLVEFIVMPAALLGVVLGPFGWDAWVWTIMGWGISGMMDVSRIVAALSGSTVHQTGFGLTSLLLIALGIVWICLWRSRIRLLGIIIMLMGVGLASLDRPPDLMIDARGRSLALRGLDGRLQVLNGKGNDFAVSQWLLGDGDARKPHDAALTRHIGCDPSGCVAAWVDGRTVALVLAPQALGEDCARADVVITRLFAGSRCKGPELVLDGAHFASHGATALTLRADGTWGMRVSRPEATQRAWYPVRPPRFSRAPPVAGGDFGDEESDPRSFAAD